MFNQMYQNTFALRNHVCIIAQQNHLDDFYYELCNIYSITDIEETTLDYLTEMETFFP